MFKNKKFIVEKRTLILVAILVGVVANGALFFMTNYGRNKLSSFNKTIQPRKSSEKKPKATNWEKEKQAIVFAAKGNSVAYKVQQDDGRWKVYFNGRESEAFDAVYNPVFNIDGTQFAFAASLGDNNFVISNLFDKLNAYDGATTIVFVPQINNLAYVAEQGEQSVVIVNGQESRAYDEIVYVYDEDGNSTQLIVSDDGDTIVYQVEEEGQTFIVVNGDEGKAYDDISNITIDEDGNVTYTAVDDGEEITVINGEEFPLVEDDDDTGSTSTTDSDSSDASSGSSTYPSRKHKNWNVSGTKDEVYDPDKILPVP